MQQDSDIFIPDTYKENLARPVAMVLTDSDQVVGLEQIARALPGVEFHVAAHTLVSPTLEAVGELPNVHVYPCVAADTLEMMWAESDFYLDINRYGLVGDAVNRASKENLIILTYVDTAHNPELVQDECILPEGAYDRLIALLGSMAGHPEVVSSYASAQQHVRKSLWDGIVAARNPTQMATLLDDLEDKINQGETGQTVMRELSCCLAADGRCYRAYELLSQIYELSRKDKRQVVMCLEQALYYCKDKEERVRLVQRIKDMYAGMDGKMSLPKVAIIILSYNQLQMLQDCIESIRQTVPAWQREIIVVDNASADGSATWLYEQGDIKLIANSENAGFPKGCNQGIDAAQADADIFLLNQDTVMMDNSFFWLRMGLYEAEDVGSVGAVPNFERDNQSSEGFNKSIEEYRAFAAGCNIPQLYAYLDRYVIIGYAQLIKRTVLRQVGYLDERFSPGCGEDLDLCYRIILQGYRNVLCRNSFIVHWQNQSFGQDWEAYSELVSSTWSKLRDKWNRARIILNFPNIIS